MKRMMALFIIMTLILTSCGIKVSEDDPRLEDLNELHRVLEENHADIYHTISKEDFLKEKKKIERKLHKMDDREFYLSLEYLLQLVGDAHTVILDPGKIDGFTYVPLGLEKFEGDWYIVAIGEDNKTVLGDRILSIEGHTIDEVFNLSRNRISSETEEWLTYKFNEVIYLKDGLDFLGITKKGDRVKIKSEDEEGRVRSSILTTVARPEDRNMVSLVELPFTKDKDLDFYRYSQLDEDYFYIDIVQSMEDPDYSVDDFTRDIEKELEKNNYKYVIIDIRRGGGGNQSKFNSLLEYVLYPLKKDGIEYYTLINNQTFSAGVSLAIKTKNILDSTLVGSPTGGLVNGYGDSKKHVLENSGISFYYSSIYSQLDPSYTSDSYEPDILVVNTLENYKKSIDEEIEAIYKYNNER